MTEQVFIREFRKMPESVKQEMLAFFERLLNKHNIPMPVEPQKPSENVVRKAGFLKGTFIMSDDFDAPLDDFKEYM